MLVFVEHFSHLCHLIVEVPVHERAELQGTALTKVCALVVAACEEEAVLVQLEGVQQAELGFDEVLIELLKVRLHHNKVERAVKTMVVVDLVQPGDLGCKVLAKESQEITQPRLEHVRHVSLPRVRVVTLPAV